jgi:hypothetical protein
MNGHPWRIAGWLSLATGVVVILALVFLVMFLVGNFTNRNWLLPLGFLNDSLIGLEALLSAVLAWMLCPLHRTHAPGASRLGLVAA